MTLGLLYAGMLLLGFVYALLTGVFSALFDHGDIHADASGHLDVDQPHPVTGTTIAAFITGFGGGGVIGHYALDLGPLGSGSIALASGFGIAGAAWLVVGWILRQTQAGSEFSAQEATGRDAEVITAIPAGAAGEVAYLMRGQREVSAARTVDGSALAKGAGATIERVSGALVYVRPKD